jgi:hypothetical protein
MAGGPSGGDPDRPEVAKLLGVSERTLRWAVDRGDFEVKPLRIGKRVVFSRIAIYRLVGLVEASANGSRDSCPC